MLYLEAVGQDSDQRGRWPIAGSDPLILGRSEDNDCPIPWDPQVSRKHAELVLERNQLRIRCFPDARNRILLDGRLHAQVVLTTDQECQIGRTTLKMARHLIATAGLGILDDGVSERGTTTDHYVGSTDYRVAIVSRSAPALWLSQSDEALAAEAVRILRQVVTNADLLVVLECENVKSSDRPQVVHWDKPPEGATRSFVSRRLIRNAIEDAETAMQVETDVSGEPVTGGRWAFCVPVSSAASRAWCIYAGGVLGEGEGYGPRLKASDLKGDASLTEVVAQLVGAIRHVRSLQSRFAGVQQFFSPSVMSAVAMTPQPMQNLAPRETDVVVLFCDLRGFSRMVEESSDDLHGLLRRISAALGVMTHSIIELDGVIADFQGDSALGFWGWPIELDGSLAACRAALRIQRIFELAASDDDLSEFQVGIGLSSGRAIAGRIGTRDQAKVGVFGSVVNVASRLEGITKRVGVPILMDSATAMQVRELPDSEGRCRRIGNLQPVGFERAIDVYELLHPPGESSISDRDIAHFEGAVAAFETGDWEKSRELLGTLPAHDRAGDFLLLQIAAHNYQPPSGWDGVIAIESK